MVNSEEERMEEGGLEGVTPAQQLCRFFSQGRHCNFGKKCKFLHVRDDGKAHGKETVSTSYPAASVGHRPSPVRRPCRYFIAGHCTMEDRCRFWHPPQLALLDDQPVPGNQTRAEQRIQPVPHPSVFQEVKLSDMTEDIAKQLRDTEISQLKKRFPKDQLIIQERSDGKVTYYRATVEATDPDWVNTSFVLQELSGKTHIHITSLNTVQLCFNL